MLMAHLVIMHATEMSATTGLNELTSAGKGGWEAV